MTFQQRELDKVTERMPKEEIWELHSIYCDCERCELVRKEKK